MIVGESAVGKTSVITRIHEDVFYNPKGYSNTIGVDWRITSLTVSDGSYVPETKIRLQVWDTAGMEKYHAITPAYYRSMHAFIFMYAANDLNSFDRIESIWLPNIKK